MQGTQINLPEKRILISDLCEVLNVYMSKAEIENVYKAYIIAATAHDGQYRNSGEAYVFHPINVAMILAELKLDCYCIIAALLHDCIEDTTLTQENIVEEFGKEVAHIVQGVSKLTGLEFHSNIEQQAQNFRKLFLAMSSDMRVMMIKLADRLHNMRTLGAVNRQKQLRIAKETAEIHAPIARRLGLNNIRSELEELCFKFIYPYRHKVLAHQINKRYGNLKEIIIQIQGEIKHRLAQEALSEVKISGRKKATYSIYKKMMNKHLKFSEVLDMYAFRVIVKDVSRCYQALGIIHNLYKPVPGKFKDYIALPKVNGYQSLHTVLFGPSKIFIEVQIRSEDMDFISEYGIAAHWYYKSKSADSSELANNWIGSLLDIQENSGTSIEFLEETKIDLFPSEIFVFTPKGEIIQLPYKSTVLDFAYSIHTKVGNHTLRAKVDQVSASLSKELKTGQTIEIMTDENAKPQPSWLKIVVTAKAKTSIKSKLKEESVPELIQLGEYLLTNALEYLGDGVLISEEKWQDCLLDLKCDSKADLYIKIALSEILISFVLNKLNEKEGNISANRINIKGTKGNPINFSRCCYPIPGDRAAGVLTNSKGMVLHRFDCGNLIRAKQKGEQWMEVNWQVDEGEEFEVEIHVKIENRRGMLASIANAIAKINVNIENIELEERDYTMKGLNLVISVPSITKLDEVIYAIKSLEFVHSVIRNNSRKKNTNLTLR
ncbi:Guanosine-3',5'-bis(diphosphate) 3'-pyrophosphohydrolase (EC 3.1.7.2) / GTP pyrophosphokinase (EC 2.7.6.5), (p)ppGpp synthetase II [uncultured Gammaproteobacteria bacterium]|jgi:GTP pyrophosphokinase|nr:Guanosine-3',5'-bis(diphosphate) 3'-pyrophosphohydrolase (EC 3.1.7.2) / GTP pyrophosphokinase (EC 2.7.6.5), (p)ppGpp synthetase II [uncultured Gammaproteobacteria bacterium]